MITFRKRSVCGSLTTSSPGLFPHPPIFWGKSPRDEVGSLTRGLMADCTKQFCLHYPEKTHTSVDTGACRSARTSNPSVFQNYRQDYKTAFNCKTSYDENQTSKYEMYTAGYENPKPLCGTKGTYIPACWNQLRCRQLWGRGMQELMTVKCLQAKITKLANKNSNECWPRLIQVCNLQLNISQNYPLFLLADLVVWSVAAK